MPHRCVKCGKEYKEASFEVLKGCEQCGGKKFLYTRVHPAGEPAKTAARSGNRVQIGSLHVLDQRNLQLVPLGKLANERRDALKSGKARRAHAALARDQLVSLKCLCHENWLEHAVLPDARRELLEARVIDPVTRLVRVGGDPPQRNVHYGRRTAGPLRNRRREPAAQG